MNSPKDALSTLGTLIDANQKRDAIHLAVYPAQAGERLEPGYHVSLNDNGEAVHGDRDNGAVGIVDPFLPDGVNEGDWFWLVLYPRTITSLRHDWEHPGFPDKPAYDSVQQERDHQVKLLIGEPEAVARQQIREIASEVNLDEDELLQAAADYLEHGETISTGDNEIDLPTEFWDAYETFTGNPVPKDKRYSFFRCAC